MSTRSIVMLIFVLSAVRTSGAYQLIDFENPDGEMVRLKWGSDSMPVPYWVSAQRTEEVSVDDAVSAIRASFGAWQAVDTASIDFNFAGTTTAEPFVFFDFLNTLGFVSDPDLEGTGILGATNWVFFSFTGEIAEADIFFNAAVPWTVAANGEEGRFDFQSVATHEIGHFLGLGHSHTGVMETSGQRRALLDGSAIMFPFSFPSGSVLGRVLQPDDIAAVSILYPAAGFTRSTGSLSGSVLKQSSPVFGAYINVFNPFTKEVMGAFTDDGGSFSVAGLKPGPYIVRVNPITDPTSPEDFAFPEQQVDLDFRDAFFEGRAEVRPGQTTSGIRIEVQR